MPETPRPGYMSDQRIVGYCEECSCPVIKADARFWCPCLTLGKFAWQKGWQKALETPTIAS